VVWNGDELELRRLLGRPARRREPSVSGLALMVGLRGRDGGGAHHAIHFPADYGAEFDDLFVHHRLPRDPTLYVSDPGEGDPECASRFVLVNAPAGAAVSDDYERRIVDRLGWGDRAAVCVRRGPKELERETGAVGGAIYGAAPHGRLALLARPGPRVRGVRNLWRVGGTVHPGGGIPLVMLGGRRAAREIARGL
jgi:phytoene dehydrogenase-like protein